MRRRSGRPILAAALLLSAGCDSLDLGSGTGSIYAVADATASLNRTRVDVELRILGEPLESATVRVESMAGDTAMDLEHLGAGQYSGTLMGYVADLTVSAISGEEDLFGALRGPGAHEIAYPPDRGRVMRGEASDGLLEVHWEAETDADEVTVEAGRLPITLSGDASKAMIPLGGLRNGDQTVIVERSTRVPLLGGAPGSQFRIRYSVDNQFTLE